MSRGLTISHFVPLQWPRPFWPLTFVLRYGWGQAPSLVIPTFLGMSVSPLLGPWECQVVASCRSCPNDMPLMWSSPLEPFLLLMTGLITTVSGWEKEHVSSAVFEQKHGKHLSLFSSVVLGHLGCVCVVGGRGRPPSLRLWTLKLDQVSIPGQHFPGVRPWNCGSLSKPRVSHLSKDDATRSGGGNEKRRLHSWVQSV